MLRVFSLVVAVTSAIHVGDKKAATPNKQQHAAVVQATKQHKPLRKALNLANTLSALSHVKKQEPAAEEPPAGDLPIDEEGYKEDWGTEFKNGAYPPEAAGKQHHPNYDTVAAEVRSEIRWASWWWWIVAAVVVAAIAGLYFYKKSS